MKITRKEVKTIYDIEISFKDYCDLRSKAKRSTTAEVMGAFKNANLEDNAIGTLRKEFCDLQFESGGVETLQYIVRELGFDGVENYGYYKDKGHGVHRMTVYDNGDNLN